MAAKAQFKMYIETDLRERLNDAADRFHRGSAQDLVEEIVSIYLPTWIAVNTSMNRAIDVQAQKRLEDADRSNVSRIERGEEVALAKKTVKTDERNERSNSSVSKSRKRGSK